MSERYDNKIKAMVPSKIKNDKQVLVINFNEINETENLNLTKIIENIYLKFDNFFPKHIKMNLEPEEIKKNMLNRILDMNKFYETKLKDLSFNFVSRKYGTHGSHRDRKNTPISNNKTVIYL